MLKLPFMNMQNSFNENILNKVKPMNYPDKTSPLSLLLHELKWLEVQKASIWWISATSPWDAA